MPPVLVTCPMSGALLPTGAHADDAEDLEHLPDAGLVIACPNCGRDHEWTRQDAVIPPR